MKLYNKNLYKTKNMKEFTIKDVLQNDFLYKIVNFKRLELNDDERVDYETFRSFSTLTSEEAKKINEHGLNSNTMSNHCLINNYVQNLYNKILQCIYDSAANSINNRIFLEYTHLDVIREKIYALFGYAYNKKLKVKNDYDLINYINNARLRVVKWKKELPNMAIMSSNITHALINYLENEHSFNTYTNDEFESARLKHIFNYNGISFYEDWGDKSEEEYMYIGKINAKEGYPIIYIPKTAVTLKENGNGEYTIYELSGDYKIFVPEDFEDSFVKLPLKIK